MDPKTYKLYNSLVQFGSLDINENSSIPWLFNELIHTDYNLALSVWEFLLIKYENKLNDGFLTKTLITGVYKSFKNKNLIKINKAILENTIFLKALFLNSKSAEDKDVLDFAVSLIIQGKFEQGHEVFKSLAKNPNINYGNILKEIFEAFFSIIFVKSSDKKIIKINKKTAGFFMEYINKIKGSEKALLTQRINEIN